MSCKFKIGDLVIGNDLANKLYEVTKKGWIGRVEIIENFEFPEGWPREYLYVTSMNDPSKHYTVRASAFDLYEPHDGKILIMVDEKDPNKIIARDLITNKTAEAKRNPKDDWDFAKGAKLALERLTEPEKPKGWTGKVVYIGPHDTILFKVGKVYNVINGLLHDETPEPWCTYERIKSFEDLKHRIWSADFIEYKGGADD